MPKTNVLAAGFFRSLAKPPYCDDPHARLEPLRGTYPKLRTGEVVVTGYADAQAVFGSPVMLKPALPFAPSKSVRTMFKMFLMLNAPDHPRLRRAVMPFFTPNAVARRTDQLNDLAHSLVGDRSEIEVIEDFAYSLPLAMIGSWLGVPTQDHHLIAEWGHVLTAALDAPIPIPPAAIPTFLKACVGREVTPLKTLRGVTAITKYARAKVTDPNAPGEFLEVLRDAVNEGVMSTEEAVATWVLIVIAGHETTANLIGNCMHLLVSHADQLDAVQQDRALVGNAIEETLRLEGPVPLFTRVASEPVTLGGYDFKKKESVFICMSAANRDPEFFENPTAFDIHRPKHQHLAFGYGSHFCLGAQLARIEAEAAINALLDAGLTKREGPPPRWRGSFATRGLQELHLKRG